MRKRTWRASTLAVHAGETLDPHSGSVVGPIHQSATFAYPLAPTAGGGWRPSPYFYTRMSNPTTETAEQKIAALEGADACLAFSSGMAAMAAAVFTYAASGDRVATITGLYGGTRVLLADQVPRLGIHIDETASMDSGTLADLVREDTRLVVTEAPTNPFNRLMDVRDLRTRLDRRWGRRRPHIVTDATFATPLNLRPIGQGADLSLHSATKYLNGHSDILGGCLSGSKKDIDRLSAWRRNVGAVMDPHQAFLLNRGMKTLELRLRRAENNASRLAQLLERHPKVEAVWHLSLPGHPDHRLGRRMLRGPGAIVALQLRSRRAPAARRFLHSLRIFAPAPSLGGVESLVSIPYETSHKSVPEPERRRAGITRTLVRLAVGIEDAQDLEEDLRQALRNV